MADTRSDLLSLLLRLFVTFALAAATFAIIFPFLGAGLWATMIAVTTWPALLRLQRALGGRRAPAVALATLAILLVLFVPLAVGTTAVFSNAARVTDWVTDRVASGVRPAPDWVEPLPVVGPRLDAVWDELAAEGREGLTAKVRPHLAAIGKWSAARAGSLASVLVQFLLTVLIAGVLFARGEVAARGVLAFARRLGGTAGEEAVLLAGRAMRGVALGIVVTALAQTVVAGLGLFVAGVPFAPTLTAVVLALCVVQVGAVPVLLPVAGWLFWSGHPGWGTFIVICTVGASLLDSVLRPVLIRRGANLPLLLTVAGVFGGLLAFGLLGLFVGPIVLAVSWTLLTAWVNARPTTDAGDGGRSPAAGSPTPARAGEGATSVG